MRSILGLFLMSLFIFSFAVSAETADDTSQVTGTVEKVAKDGTYIMVDNVKVFIDGELLEDAYFQEGDKVKIIVEQTNRGFEALDYEYLFDEQDDSNLDEEQLTPDSAEQDY